MNVIYASSVDLSLPRGPSVNEREFCVALANRFGKTATLIIPSPCADSSAVTREISAAHVDFLPAFRKRKIRSWLAHQFSLYKALSRTKKALENDKDPLFVFRLDYMPAGMALFVLLAAPTFVVKTAGDGSFRFLSRHGLLVRSSGLLNRLLHKLVFRRAKFIDVVTRRHAEDLANNLDIDAGKIGVVDNGVNTARFIPEDRQQARDTLGLSHFHQLIGYVGNEPWCRGGRELIQIAGKMLDKRQKIGFLIVGGGDRLDELVELARKNGVEDAICFAGQVSYSETVTYINSLDVGVSFLEPHHRGASEQKVRQYLGCGRPAVVTPGGSEFVEEAGVGAVVDPEDQSLLVEALLEWVDRSPGMTDQCREFAHGKLSVEARLEERLRYWSG